jgi:DNA-binding HxlR family transcriptional regulator
VKPRDGPEIIQVIKEKEMSARTYGQYCGLARALELVGERWALLVVRDLVLGPKRFTDLRATLDRIPASILSARLNELEQAGVVRRRVLGSLDAAVVYELTSYGAELDTVVLQLGLWGARSLGEKGDHVFTLDSAILSLYTTFRPQFAGGVNVSYELHYGEMVVHAIIRDGVIQVAAGPYPEADLVIRPQASIMPLMSGDMSADEAINEGVVKLEGDEQLLHLFSDMFHIPAAPRPAEGLAVH